MKPPFRAHQGVMSREGCGREGTMHDIEAKGRGVWVSWSSLCALEERENETQVHLDKKGPFSVSLS